MSAFMNEGVEALCFPEANERESERQRERQTNAMGVSVHRFQLWVPSPASNQMNALLLIKKLQL
jgi:hypothetical protein